MVGMRGRLLQGLLLTCLGLGCAWLGTRYGGFHFAAHAQGYSGVAPGSNAVPDGIAAAPGSAALVTWPGFQMLPTGASRVFIQTSVEVRPDLKREGNIVYISLISVSLPKGNARLPLDTKFFNTPVKSVRAKARKDGGVVVEIDLRSNVSPSMRTERASTGYYFVYIDFPAGNYRY
jgi:hypothetical protein